MLWTCSTIPRSQFDPALLPHVVGEERRRRVQALRRPEQQWQCLTADRLLWALARHQGLGRHAYLPSGQPVIEGAHVSVSHDTAVVAAVISDDPVGVDVVDVQRCERLEARHVLSPTELQRLIDHGGRPEPTPLQKARSWAAKEATLKKAGRGLDVDPRRLTLHRGADGWTVKGVLPEDSPVQLAALGSVHLVAFAGGPESVLSTYIPLDRITAEFHFPDL